MSGLKYDLRDANASSGVIGHKKSLFPGKEKQAVIIIEITELASRLFLISMLLRQPGRP